MWRNCNSNSGQCSLQPAKRTGNAWVSRTLWGLRRVKFIRPSIHPIHLIDNTEQYATACCQENKRLCFPGNYSSKAPASLLSALSHDEIQ